MTTENQPAFPCNWHDFQPDTGNQVIREQYFGITVRDYFAAKAMAALIASNDEGAGDRITDVPAYAYDIADAMLAARRSK